MSSSMTSPILNQKRTRSQLTLPDQLIHQLGSRSPLKHARAALRNSCDAELAPGDTEDELLLSPRKNALSEFRAPKRSASPTPVYQHSSSPDSSSTDRGSKRLKRDADHAAKSSHTRSISQPDTTNANIVPNTSELPSNARAQSAPLFASSSSSTMPHIDFRNPPPSPRRARSRSPSKEPGFRILSGPSISKLDTILDEPNPAMNVDPDDRDFSAPSHPLPDVSDARSVTAVTPDIQEAALDKLPIPTIVKPPSTPATQRPTTLFSMSPLTPISETPFPPNAMASCRDRCTGPACLEEEEEQVQAESLGLPLHLPKLFPSVKPHTKCNPLTSATTIPPQPSSSSTGAATNLPTNKIKPSGPKPTTSGPKDAFVFLMDNARHKKDSAKGKAISTKAGSSSSIASKLKNITTSTPSKESKVKANVKGKEVAQETPHTPKVSLKAKMKPKTTPKAKPVPVPIPHPNDEPEAGDRSLRTPSPRLPTPAKDTAPLRPATLVPMDVSMQPINPSPLDAHEIPHHPQTSPKTHDAETSEALAPDSLSERPPEAGTGKSIANEGLIVNVLPEAPAMPPPPPANKTDEITNSETIIPPEDSEISALPLKPVPKKKTGNKRLPNAVPARVTRSVSSRQNNTRVRDSNLPSTTLTQPILGCKESPSATTTGPSSTGTKLLPRFAPAAAPRNDSGVSTSSLSDLPTDPIMADPPSLPPGLPMKVESHGSLLVRKRSESSFARPTLSTTAKQTAPSKTPAKPLQFRKPGTPSPSKIARSASMHTSRPSSASRMSRTFSSYTSTIGPPSSLSTLSSALEKLRMPPPGRPNTSMGFNRDVGSDDGPEGDAANTTSKDDIATEKNKPGPRPSIGASSVASGSQLVQRTLTGGKASTSSLNAVRTSSIYGRGAIMRGPGGFKVPGTMRVGGAQPKIFGVGGRAFAGAVRARAVQKASRKTSLPSVMASPVKGSGAGDDDDDVDMDMGMGMQDVKGDASGSGANTIMEWNGDASTEPLASDVGSGESAKGKEKDRRDAWKMNASRRVSLASQALSQSLSDLPPTNGKEPSGLGVMVMGPPATPGRDGRRSTRSASSSYPPSQAGSTAIATPDVDDSEKSPRTRSVTRSLRKVDKMQEVGGGTCHASDKKASVGQESLKILDGCVIFVDVRNDDGDEVGSLFVEMLEGVGARILTRVGQTCTHIVFKNGLMSTLRRYRLLRDPKPLVVGIAWVVECVEQMKHVNENKFLIDLDGVNVSGTNKRRRSMLPKLISRPHDEGNSSEVDHDGGDGDVSLDGSTSSLMLDDNLTPLEKARRRKGKT